MGKKRVIEENKEAVLKEGAKIEAKEKKSAEPQVAKKSKFGHLNFAKVYIQSTYNNTIITLTDDKGSIVIWSSAGALGFKGPKKATPFAASRVIETILEKTRNLGIREVGVFVRGVGGGREGAIRALANQGLEISFIKDVTPVPHNGCRAPKPRRV